VSGAADPPFPLVCVDGDPFARGDAYGHLAADRIARSLAFYERAIERTGGLTFGQACDVVMEHLAGWRAQAPDVLEEVDGIAHGSGVPFEAVLVLNARDTFMHRRRSTETGAHDFDDGCTSFAVLSGASDDGHVRSGQNWDYHPEIRDTIVLLRVGSPTDPTILTIVEAGQVARQGANARGLALQANGLPSERRDESALPGPIARRRILSEAGWDPALARALEAPRAGRTNLLLTSRDDRLADIEASHRSSRIFHATRDRIFAHANHFELGVPDDHRGDAEANEESVSRSSRANASLGEARNRGGVGASDLMALARSHLDPGGQICDHGAVDPDWVTVASTVTDLTDGVMWVAAGPPCEHDYVPIDIVGGPVRSGMVAVGGTPYPPDR
jgi:isopenicillin-N N-acyltransferase-like protein